MADLLHSINNPRSVENRVKEMERKLSRLQARVLRLAAGKAGAGDIATGPVSPTLPAPDASDVTVGVTHNYAPNGAWQPTLTATVNTTAIAGAKGLYGFHWYVTDPLGHQSDYVTLASQDANLPIQVAPTLGLALRPPTTVSLSNQWNVAVASLSLSGEESAQTPLPPFTLTAPTNAPPAPTGLVAAPRTLAVYITFDAPTFPNYAWTEVYIQPHATPGSRIFVMSTTTPRFILPWDKFNYEESPPSPLNKIVLRHRDTFGNMSADSAELDPMYTLLNPDNLEIGTVTPGTYNSVHVTENGIVDAASVDTSHYDQYYFHTQSVAATEWTIVHSFGSNTGFPRRPVFVALDGSFVPLKVIGVTFDDDDTMLLDFATAVSGYAILS